MSRNNFTCGIDVGTHATRVVVMGHNKGTNDPSVLAVGQSLTEGMRFGYITNIDQVAKSIKKAVKQAEDILGSKIRRAYVSIGGINLSSIVSTGSVIISKADQEITHLDVEKAIALSEENLEILNKKIIHAIPILYKLDGKDIHGKPEGMHGVKLEVKMLFIICLKQNIDDLITAFAQAQIEVEDIMAGIMASSAILLSSKQKIAGCALIDIGAETVTFACFENGLLISLQVIGIGSMDITKDIALGFRISLEEAESIKLGSVIGGDYPKKKVDEIIEARLSDIFELVGNHLKRLHRNELLPAGMIITGGGAHINNIEDLARSQLRLPAKIGPSDMMINNKLKIKDASWYTAFGLAMLEGDELQNNNISSDGRDNVNQIKRFFKSIFSQLLP
jgi:cell division protein FtsA